jgi:hypothetical protein
MAVGTLSNVKVDPVAGTFTGKYLADSTVTATAVFCGFTPRTVKLTQIAGSLGTSFVTISYESMAAGTNGNLTLITNATGVTSLITANGVTFLAGTEASPASAATGSPASSGMGFTIGTGIVGVTQTYLVEAVR